MAIRAVEVPNNLKFAILIEVGQGKGKWIFLFLYFEEPKKKKIIITYSWCFIGSKAFRKKKNGKNCLFNNPRLFTPLCGVAITSYNERTLISNRWRCIGAGSKKKEFIVYRKTESLTDGAVSAVGMKV